jgi:Tfp pilus assembly protein PilX
MNSRLRTRLRDDDGNALVTAMLVMTLLMILSFSTLSYVDVQQKQSRVERVRETTFNASEGVLSAQIFQLSTRWPGKNDIAYPNKCQNGVTSTDCPGASQLVNGMQNVDTRSGITWTTYVRDNGGASPTFYQESVVTTQPALDANDDGFVWVRAQAVVRGKRRTLVALVKAEEVTLNFPKVALMTGYFATGNNGNKNIVINGGGDIVVRCNPGASCADFRDGQLNPGPVTYAPTQPNALAPEALDALRERAKSYGNYYTGCPPSLAGDVPGEIVFVENGTCKFTANGTYNTAAKPGIFIMARGTMELAGTLDFHGLFYHANVDNSSAILVHQTGCSKIWGSLVIDGRGGTDIGNCANNLNFNANVFNSLKTFGTAGVVQNTFREIDAKN